MEEELEHPQEHVQEQIHEAAHHTQERWIFWVAMTAALLAAFGGDRQLIQRAPRARGDD